MRYRLMASYLGGSYQAAVGPSDRDVTLFAAPPPPEEHGFSPASGGVWRKQVRLDELDALWESRPIGSYHGEPCLVLDDLGDRLHIVYLGMEERRAGQLGYWQVDRGVFEVVVPRAEVTDLAEERHEFPITLLLSSLPRALNAGDPGAGRRRFLAWLRFGGPGRRRGGKRRNRNRPDGPAKRRPGRQRGRRRDRDVERSPATGARELPAAQPQPQPQPQPSVMQQPAGRAAAAARRAAGDAAVGPAAVNAAVDATGRERGWAQAMTGAYQSPSGMASAQQLARTSPAHRWRRAPRRRTPPCPRQPTRRPAYRRAPPRRRRPRILGGIRSQPAQQGPPMQQGFAAQPGAGAQQFPATPTSAAQQATVTQQTAVGRPGGASQLSNAQPPAAVAGCIIAGA